MSTFHGARVLAATLLTFSCFCLFATTPDVALADSKPTATGDFNHDGVVGAVDLEIFILAVRNWASLSVDDPSLVQELVADGDFDEDGVLGAGDIPALTDAFNADFTAAGGVATEDPSSSPLVGFGGGMVAMMTITGAGSVDLDVDSNNNSDSTWPLPNTEASEESEEEAIEDTCGGKYVPTYFGEDDLIPMMLEIAPDPFTRGTIVEYALEYDDDEFRVWPSTGVGAWPADARQNASGSPLTPTYQHQVELLGDMTCNGAVNSFDTNAFVLALTNPAQYAINYPNCPITNADCNSDGLVNAFDVDAYVQVLIMGGKVKPVILLVECVDDGGDCGEINAIADLDGNGFSAADAYDLVKLTGNRCDGYADLYYGYGAPDGFACNGSDGRPYRSRCTLGNNSKTVLSYVNGVPLMLYPWQENEHDMAFPLNVGLDHGFGPPDMPPVSTDPFLSSTPLLSPGFKHAAIDGRFAERPTCDGLVDLVTGVPLLQEIDFELPFGGAVFRHVRTYSEDHASYNATMAPWLRATVDVDAETFNPGFAERSFWDSAGLFWMMGENPLLLIDSRYRPIADQYPEDERICYFIPDAHHAIPFIWNGSDRYEAPDWFDAHLSFTGGSLDANGEWITMPTAWAVSLHRGAVKYTIQPYYEDVGTTTAGVSNHEHTDDGGHGLPYYGLTTAIEDRYGHIIEIEYVDFFQGRVPDGSDDPNDPGIQRWSYDPTYNPDVVLSECFESHLAWGDSWRIGDGCLPCAQNCYEKGQIRNVKLKVKDASGNTDTKWTLLYTYRGFAKPGALEFAAEAIDPYENWELYHQTMVHSILAYEGDVGDPRTYDDLTIPAWQFWNISSFDDYDAVEPPLPSEFTATTDWSVAVRYTYDELEWADTAICYAPQFYQTPYCNWTKTPASAVGGMHLLKASVLNKQAEDTTTEEDSVYWYSHYKGPAAAYRDRSAHLLAAFDPGDVGSLVADENNTINSANDLLYHYVDDLWHGGYCASDYENNDPSLADHARIQLSAPKFALSCSGQDVQDLAAHLGFDADQLYASAQVMLCGRDDNNETRRQVCSIFHQYYAECTPPTTILDLQPGWAFISEAQGWLYKYPYRWTSSPIAPVWEGFNPLETQYHLEYLYDDDDFHSPDFEHSFFIAIVDELGDEGEPAYDLIGPEGVKSRQVIEMNARGAVLRTRTYSYEGDASGELVDATGYGVRKVYDSNGRVCAIRSTGNAVAENGSVATPPLSDPTADGLVQVFEYDDTSGELIAVAVQEGFTKSADPAHPVATAASKRYVRYLERDPNAPEVITCDITFSKPVADLTANPELLPGAAVTRTLVKYHDDNVDKGVQWKRTLRPATKPGEDIVAKHAITWEVFDRQGNEILKGEGLCTYDGNNTTTPEAPFYVTESTYDNDYGWMLKRVVDVDCDAVTRPANAPASWERLPQTGAGLTTPLRLTTVNNYELPFGLVRSVTCDEAGNFRSATHVNYVIDTLFTTSFSSTFVWEKWIYPGLHQNDQSEWETEGPVTMTRYYNGRVVYEAEYECPSISYCAVTDPEQVTCDPEMVDPVLLSSTIPGYDPSGRVTSVTREADDDSLSASVLYHATGQVTRSQAPDGTLNRYEYDYRGRLTRTFQGTADDCVYWGGSEEEPDDDMLLTEKRYYGSADLAINPDAIQNVGQLVGVRTYRDAPVNIYYEGWECLQEDLEGNCISESWGEFGAPNEDVVGALATYEYDWRMRPVCVTEYDENDVAIRRSFSWLDNLDRAVLQAVYDGTGGPGASEDPRDLAPGASVPTAATVITNSAGLQSLTETVYNSRGLVEQTRDYNVTTGTYTATITYFDHADRPVEVISPNAPKQQNIYDAKGRLIVMRSLDASDVMLTETQTTYNFDDRATQTINSELTHDGAAYVSTFAHNWYDLAGRVTTSVNYGTNDDGFITGTTAPTYDAANPPAASTAGLLRTDYEYDEAGRQIVVVNPDGTETHSEYDGLGRLVLTTENAADRDSDGQVRYTAYLYDEVGRLAAMAAVTPEHFTGVTPEAANVIWAGGSNATIQITTFEYAAEVYPATWSVSWNGVGWTTYVGDPADPQTWAANSAHNSWISTVTYPDGDYLYFTYYSDGSVASRTDARGVTFYYEYDDQGRLATVYVDDSAFYASPIEPPNRVHQIDYAYYDDGALESVTAYTLDAAGAATVVAENTFTYDVHDNLTSETQQHFGDATPRTISYVWDHQPYGSGNYNRLTSMTYPSHTDVGLRAGRTLTFGYDVDPANGQPLSITDSTAGVVAQFAYAGGGRRVSFNHGASLIQQTFADATGYPGLDRFGRVRDLNFKRSGSTLHRYRYDYDKAGNRIYALTTLDDFNGDRDNVFSYAYAYDALQRLVGAQRGALLLDVNDDPVIDGNGLATLDTSLSTPELSLWSLDLLGNWSGIPSVAGGLDIGPDANGDWSPDSLTKTFTHDVTLANQIATFHEDAGSQTFVHNASGNLVFDGVYYYQYDAFSRVLQISAAGTLTDLDFDGDGQLTGGGGGAAGAVQVQYAYDGLGRLIRRRYPDFSGLDITYYYYYGVRRIQQIGAVDTGTTVIYAESEWAYTPGYVDEFVCSFDGNNALRYLLQDANYNLTAVVNAATGWVLEQYVWSPYGEVVQQDQQYSGAWNPVGHQGLFYEPVNPTAELPTNTTAVNGLYYNRNRFYSPRYGRFTSRDPNATAMLLQKVSTQNTQEQDNSSFVFDPREHYDQGMNLEEYLGGNPTGRLDPEGTVFFAVPMAVALGYTFGYFETMDALGIRPGTNRYFTLIRQWGENVATTWGLSWAGGRLMNYPMFAWSQAAGKAVQTGTLGSGLAAGDAFLAGFGGGFIAAAAGAYVGALDAIMTDIAFDLGMTWW